MTAVGYAGGNASNPTYQEVRSGMTGHNLVCVVFDPKQVGCAQLFKAFWEAHDLAQGMRQGNDVGKGRRPTRRMGSGILILAFHPFV